MFTYEEKKYVLSLLKKEKRKFFLKKHHPEINDRLIEKLEQMIRNEEVNNKELKKNKL